MISHGVAREQAEEVAEEVDAVEPGGDVQAPEEAEMDTLPQQRDHELARYVTRHEPPARGAKRFAPRGDITRAVLVKGRDPFDLLRRTDTPLVLHQACQRGEFAG